MASLQNLGCRGPVESRVSSALGSLPPMSHCRVLRSVAYDSRSIYSKVTHTFILCQDTAKSWFKFLSAAPTLWSSLGSSSSSDYSQALMVTCFRGKAILSELYTSSVRESQHPEPVALSPRCRDLSEVFLHIYLFIACRVLQKA